MIWKTMLMFCIISAMLTGCSTSLQTADFPAAATDSPSAAVTAAPRDALSPSPSPLLTETAIPTNTAAGTAMPEPTFTLIPLPLTPVPTFDRRNAHPIQQQVQAICPQKASQVEVTEIPSPGELPEDGLLDYLNAGGKPNATAIDLTRDGIPELIYYPRSFLMSIYGCRDAKYQRLTAIEGAAYSIRLKDVLDLNKNGFPEMLVEADRQLHIYEWDGLTFRSLIRVVDDPFRVSAKRNDWVDPDAIADSVMDTYRISDLNGDGLSEIISFQDIASLNSEHLPSFKQTITLGWNGMYYVDLLPGNYEPPQYIFQATQLGDMEVLLDKDQQALAFYQAAISDGGLWTSARINYEQEIFNNPFSTIPTPTPDIQEHDRLAAYAYYRMLILYIHTGQSLEAQSIYSTLQTKYQPDAPGYPYLEMAAAFWNAYLSSGRVYSACDAAIQYATLHPEEILSPLGQTYSHGWAQHNYLPVDICPFGLP